jgi:hypothetical protein
MLMHIEIRNSCHHLIPYHQLKSVSESISLVACCSLRNLYALPFSHVQHFSLFVFNLIAGRLGDFLFQLRDAQMNNMMLQQTTNDNPSATLEDMYRNASGMTAHQLMTSRPIQENVELRSTIQKLLVPRAHQPIVSGRDNPMTLAEHRQEKKSNLVTQKQRKAAAKQQRQQQRQQQQQQRVGTVGMKAPPVPAAATTGTTTTPVVTVTTTPATTATTTSSNSTFVSGRWSNGRDSGGDFVGAGSINSRKFRNYLSTTTNTPNPFHMTASLFQQQDCNVGGGACGHEATSNEPPPAATAATAAPAGLSVVISTPRRERAKHVRVSVMRQVKKHPGATNTFRALVAGSPTAMQVIEDSMGVMCTQDTADTLMEMYDETSAGSSSQQAARMSLP